MVKRIKREQDLMVNVSIRDRNGEYILNAYLDYINLYTTDAEDGYKIEYGDIVEGGKISLPVNYVEGLEDLDAGLLKIQLKFNIDDDSYSDDEANYFKEYNTNYYLNY